MESHAERHARSQSVISIPCQRLGSLPPPGKKNQDKPITATSLPAVMSQPGQRFRPLLRATLPTAAPLPRTQHGTTLPCQIELLLVHQRVCAWHANLVSLYRHIVPAAAIILGPPCRHPLQSGTGPVPPSCYAAGRRCASLTWSFTPRETSVP